MIRQAEMSDFDAIVDVRESVALEVDRLDQPDYRIQVQKNGFLLSTGLTMEEYAADISNYLVAGQERVFGYLCLHDYMDVSSEESNLWLRPDAQKAYSTSPYAYIHGVGVWPGVHRAGIASEMLQAAEQKAQADGASWLFSMIVTSPVTNIASLLFHERNGFERAAILEVTEEAGLESFQNLVYAKQLDVVK